MNSIQLAASIAFGWVVLTTIPTWAHESHAKSTQPVKMTDEQSIEHAMKALFDKPEAPLKVAPVSVEGAYAVAGWIQYDRGGHLGHIESNLQQHTLLQRSQARLSTEPPACQTAPSLHAQYFAHQSF